MSSGSPGLKSDAIIGERFPERIACRQRTFAAALRVVEKAVAPAQGAWQTIPLNLPVLFTKCKECR
jgi:hypothetical protein